MEMYTGPEQSTTTTYMIPGTGPNPHLTYVPQLEEVDYMGTEVVPEYIYDQGLYYPAANYYGYYCTGFESAGEWDDHSRVVGVDGQDIHYSGLQTESLPYVYYTPSYGFAQSPYNPYNPYIPGAVMGLDGSYLGTQQYATNPSYQTPLSSPAYIPVVQPSTDVAPNSTQGPSLLNTGVSMASRPINTGAKYTPPLASTNIATNMQRSGVGNPTPETSQSSQTTAKSSEGALVNVPSNKQSLSQGAITVGSATHAAQVRNSSASVQAPHLFPHGRIPTIQNPLKVAASSNDSFPQFGSNIRGWVTGDKFRPRLQFHGDLNNPGGAIDVLGEQNKGPRTIRSKSQSTSASVDGVNPTKSGASNTQQIIISADQYNRDDFPVNYPDAKFFVIKSYSEDDVHKSIKYKVWSSTANGNKRLDSAYQDAQRIILGQPRNCHIFLFFSVNASGQFCGVAEMIGPVNFDKDMDFWQQDKWTGSFPVKWHIIKDVPNTSFRHIILENNENKPVTNSRDTQEIPYLVGLNMLNIFKGTPLKTSILDDFIFYEERERIMQEDKARILGRSYDASQFISAVLPVDKSDGMVTHPSKADEKHSSDTVSEPLKANERHTSATASQNPKADGKPPNGVINRSPSSTGKQQNGAVDQYSKTDGKLPNDIVCNPTNADEKGLSYAVSQSAHENGKTSNDSITHSPSKSNDSTSTDLQPPKADRNSVKLKDSKNMADRPSKADEKGPNLAINQRAKADGKPSNVSVNWPSTELPPPKADRNSSKVKDPKGTGTQPAKMDRKDTKSMGDQRPKPNMKDSKVRGDQPLKLDGINSRSSGDQHTKAETNPSKLKQQDTRKLDSIRLLNDKEDATHSRGTDSTLNVGSLVVDSREGAASSSRVVVTKSSSIAVVTVGSVPIRVEGLGESSSSVITVGTIPIDPKNLKPNKQGALEGGRLHQKYQK